MRIKYKLGWSFGIMVGLMAISMAWSRYEMKAIGKMEMTHVQLIEIQQVFMEIRRHEKNYLLRQEGIWAEKTLFNLDQLSHMIQNIPPQVMPDELAFGRNAANLLDEYRKIFTQLVKDQTLSIEEKRVEADRSLVLTARQMHTFLEKQVFFSKRSLKDFMDRFEMAYNLIIGFAMFISGVLIFTLMRSMLSSLQIGSDFVEKISSGVLHTEISKFPKDEIGLLLEAMQEMGVNLQRMDNDNIRALTARLALSAILETAMEPLSLQRQLQVILHIVLTVPFLHVQNKGAIFLVDETDDSLHMVASYGLNPSILESCAVVPKGHCLCGRTAVEGLLLFVANGDARHESVYEGMMPHGHYNVPIILRGSVQGVMTLYLDPGHSQNNEEVSFLTSVALTISGVLERKRMENDLKHMAHHDLLTSLPNRALCVEHLMQALAMATRNKDLLAVMLIDLDKFKQVNDTLGHAAGDQVLIAATQRIRKCLRASDLLTRLGGDEFAVILSDLQNPGAAGLVAGKIVESISQPIDVSGDLVRIGASIGIAIFPDHGLDADSLFANADKAMYRVKKQGRNSYCLHDADNA